MPELAALVREAYELAIARWAGRAKRGPLDAVLSLFRKELPESDLHPIDEGANDAGLDDRAFDARVAYLLAHRAEVLAAIPKIERRAGLARG